MTLMILTTRTIPMTRMPGKLGGKQSGVALILVIWTFAVLSVLAGEFARAMQEDARSTINFRRRAAAHYVAVAGLNEALLALQGARASDINVEGGDEEAEEGIQRPIKILLRTDGRWVKSAFNGMRYEVRAVDESGKIGLNAIKEEDVLLLLMKNLGYSELEAATVAHSILDWKDEDTLHRINGAEDQYYESLPRPYVAKNGYFESLEELLLVKGVTRQMFYGSEMVPGFRDIFSVFSERSLNLRKVTPPVMIALAGVEPDQAAEFTKRRRRGESISQELQQLLTGSGIRTVGNKKPSTLTLEARVKDETGSVITQVGMVVRLNDAGFQTFRWYDSVFDEPGEDLD